MPDATADNTAARRRRRLTIIWLAVAAVALGLPLALRQWTCERCAIPVRPPGRIVVSDMSEKRLTPLMVTDPTHLRWRDVGDLRYSDEFRGSFSYQDTDDHYVAVQYDPGGNALAGRIRAHRLKPWFVYQIKLVGAVPIHGATQADNEDDAAAWSSWQLGRMGRWWCDQCQWNVADPDLLQHLADGHSVRGYVLLDWFITDANGDADHQFALDRSLHVLWKVGQRDRGPNDSVPRWYRVQRRGPAYPVDAQNTVEEVAVYGEWEPTRAPVGRLRVPPGEYHVRLDLTEETWHANMVDRELAGGGFWAWVLEGELLFTVRDEPVQISRASCPGCIPGPHAGMGRLRAPEGS